jgi:hypothetical protein
MWILVSCCLSQFADAGAIPGAGAWIALPMSESSRRLEADLLGDCTLIEKCEICTFGDQRTNDACKETGRREKRKCTTYEGGGKSPVAFAVEYDVMIKSSLPENRCAFCKQTPKSQLNTSAVNLRKQMTRLQWYVAWKSTKCSLVDVRRHSSRPVFPGFIV